MRKFIIIFTIVGMALILPLGGMPADAATAADHEPKFVELMNRERAAHGLGRLSVAGDLVDYGRRHSGTMASEDSLYHSSNLRTLTNWKLLGENVGRGGSVQALHDAFMNSPSHRDNILRREFSQVGVGVVVSGSTIWVTVVFRQPETTAGAGGSSTSSSGSAARRPVGIAPTATGNGYWVAYSDGSMHREGDAPKLGTPRTSAEIVAMSGTPSNKGYWLLDAAGGVHSFGDAKYKGSIPALRNAGQNIGAVKAVGIVSTASGNGYWILDEVGGIFTFGDATFKGSIPALRSAGQNIGRADVIGMAPTGSGSGYWVLDDAGGVFTFGDARYKGSLPALKQAGKVSGDVKGIDVAPTPKGTGYWVLASTGKVFGFGT